MYILIIFLYNKYNKNILTKASDGFKSKSSGRDGGDASLTARQLGLCFTPESKVPDLNKSLISYEMIIEVQLH